MREGKAKVLSEQEFTRLLRVISVEQHAERNTAIIMMSFGLGLRVGEISTLIVGDVLNQNNAIRDHFQIRRANSKTNQNREVFLSNPKIQRALRTYLDWRRDHDPVAITQTSPLFRSQKGGAFTPNSLQQMMKRIFRRAGLPESVSSHSGRRSFATKLITGGIDIKSVSVLMGHRNISQTSEYCQSNPDVLRSAVVRAI
ncbi:tyrosine-type recombinase/integrase [Magnetovibrio blakemorei]|uniref:Tyr recombinase domain-containing protein n=1 Tax=Magnetovibrio blakemorei TaxID=28181 RepID=A0A1E5Q425_9PROT|nr:site-specific integrase [Magnetovibrio blakemorei]OEJ64572.1 hypothetical protein BEN30_16215 [Magnetovibrio blakemorei]